MTAPGTAPGTVATEGQMTRRVTTDVARFQISRFGTLVAMTPPRPGAVLSCHDPRWCAGVLRGRSEEHTVVGPCLAARVAAAVAALHQLPPRILAGHVPGLTDRTHHHCEQWMP